MANQIISAITIEGQGYKHQNLFVTNVENRHWFFGTKKDTIVTGKKIIGFVDKEGDREQKRKIKNAQFS